MEYLDTTEDVRSDVIEEDKAEECVTVEQPDFNFSNLECEMLSNLPGRDKAAAVRRGLVKRQKPSLNFLRQSVQVLPTDDHGSVGNDDSGDEDEHQSPTAAVHTPEESNRKANRAISMAHGQSGGETVVQPRVKVLAGLDPASANMAAAAAAIARSSSLRGRQPNQSPALRSDLELRGSPALSNASEIHRVDSEDEEKTKEAKKRAEHDETAGHVSRTPASNAARHPAGGKLPPLIPNKPVACMNWKLPAADGPPGGSNQVCTTAAEHSVPEADHDRPPLPPAKPPRLKAVAADDVHSLPHPKLLPPPRPAKPKAVPKPSQQPVAAQGTVDMAAIERLPGDDRVRNRPAAAGASSTGAASPAEVSADAAVVVAAASSAAAARSAYSETHASLSQSTMADQTFNERYPFGKRDVTTAVTAPVRPKKPERQDVQSASDQNPERQHEHQSWQQYDRSARPAAVETTSISFGATASERRTESSSGEDEPMRDRLDSDGSSTGRLASGAAAAAHRKRAAPVDLSTPPDYSRGASRQYLDEPATKRQQQTSDKELSVGGKVDRVKRETHSQEQEEPARTTNAKRLGTVQASDGSDARFLSAELHLTGTDVYNRQPHAAAAVKVSTRLAESSRAVFEGVATQHQADPTIKQGSEGSLQGTGRQQQLYQEEQKLRETRDFRSDSTGTLSEVSTTPGDKASTARKSDTAAVGGTDTATFGVALKSSSDHRGYRTSASDSHAGLPVSSTRDAGIMHGAREPGSAAATSLTPHTESSEKPAVGQQPFAKVPPVPRPRPPQKPALLTPLQQTSVGRGGASAADQATSLPAATVTTSSPSTAGASHPAVMSAAKAIGMSRTSEPPSALPTTNATASSASTHSSEGAAGKSAPSPEDSNTRPSAGSSGGGVSGGRTDSRAAEPSTMRTPADGDRVMHVSSSATASAQPSERLALPTVQIKHLPQKEEPVREEQQQQQQTPSVRLRRTTPPALPAFSSAGDGPEALSPSPQRSSMLLRRHTHAAYDSTPPRGSGSAGLSAVHAEPAWMRIAAEKAKRNSQFVDNGAREVAGSTLKAVPPAAEQSADPDVAGGTSQSRGTAPNSCSPLGGAATKPLARVPGGGSWQPTGGASVVASPSSAQQSSRGSGTVATPKAGSGRVNGDAGRDAVSSARVVQQHRSTKEADTPSRTTSAPPNDENQPPPHTAAGSPRGSTAKGSDGPLVIGHAQPLLPLTSKSSSSSESQPLGERRHSSDSPAAATNGTHALPPRILPPGADTAAATGTSAAPVDDQADVTLRVGRSTRHQHVDKRIHSVVVTASSGGPSSPGRHGVEETALNSPRARAGSGPKDSGDIGSQEPEFMKLFRARQSRLRASSVQTFDD